MRHIFRAKNLPTSVTFPLKRIVTDNEDTIPEAAHSLEYNFSMDDYLESSPTVEEATWKAQDFAKILAKGGFSLKKFVSYVRGVLSTLNRMKNPIDGKVKALTAGDESSHVLGLKWIY